MRSERSETGLTEIHEQRMLRKAIRAGWLNGQRWATDATIEELKQRLGNLTVKERALLCAIEGMQSGDHRVKQRAVENIISMESQNQRDEIIERESSAQHIHFHSAEPSNPDEQRRAALDAIAAIKASIAEKISGMPAENHFAESHRFGDDTA